MTLNQFAGELSADRFTVKKVLDLARAGKLRIPPFQRPLRWRRPDHRLLLDSLYRRYPIGTLLLWERPAPAATAVFGSLSIAAAETSAAYWIVDGQQRITSIVGCLLQPDDPVRRSSNEFSFLFDLVQEQFVDAAGQSAPHLVPVGRLRDPVETSIWARENGVDDELHRKAQAVGSRLLGYEIPTYVTTAESDEVLRTIFARANTAGRRMREGEVFEALNKGLHPTDSPAGLTERLQQVLHALGFGAVDSDDLQRALVFVAGYNPRDRLPDELKVPGAAAAWEHAVAAALGRTVEFLRDATRIPHARLLPYSLPLIVLPRLFHLFPVLRERSVELLVRWVWRGIAHGAHMATNQNFNPIHRVFRQSSKEEDIIQGLLSLLGHSRPPSYPESSVYNLRGMRTKVELTALFGRAPRHVVSTSHHVLSAIEIFEDGSDPPGDHEQIDLFDERSPAQPPAATRGATRVPHLPSVAPSQDPELVRSVAARFLHPPIDGNREFATRLSKAPADVLASHAIPDHAISAARGGRWDQVIAARRQSIRDDVKGTIDRLARWDEDGDVPSIDAIILDADDQPDAAP